MANQNCGRNDCPLARRKACEMYPSTGNNHFLQRGIDELADFKYCNANEQTRRRVKRDPCAVCYTVPKLPFEADAATISQLLRTLSGRRRYDDRTLLAKSQCRKLVKGQYEGLRTWLITTWHRVAPFLTFAWPLC